MIDKKRAIKPKKRRNVTMAESRYVGSYPVIGIRPTIDGRKGVLDVRGSLEDQTIQRQWIWTRQQSKLSGV